MIRRIKNRFTRSGAFTAAVFLVLGTGGFISFWLCLPDPLFDTPYSTVVEDSRGDLLGARIADDGQWRFPPADIVPYKFEQAILQFEDRWYYYHPGVNPLAGGRALLQNIRERRIVSGASTLTMQTVRLSRMNKSSRSGITNTEIFRERTVSEKIKEMTLALRLEFRHSKRSILSLYAAHAPFGGNVVGLEAAAWRYFGVSPHQLSWAETATLAVLPNSPSLIHPGRNRELLRIKRDSLLDRLHRGGIIDSLTAELSKAEPLPESPRPLPSIAPHLTDRIYTGPDRGTRVLSSIDRNLQERVTHVVNEHHKILNQNHIHNAAAIIADARTGKVIAYVGNADIEDPEKLYGGNVDIVTAQRSTGSILKPFLYALAINDGRLLPDMLLPDIPTQVSGYAPQNFSRRFDGMVPADQALARSLNIPAVRLLQDYGVPRLHYYLKAIGMSTLNQPPEHYGLSLILGGADGTLWDVTGMYVSMARHLNDYDTLNREKSRLIYSRRLSYKMLYKDEDNSGGLNSFLLNTAAIWSTFEAMLETNRPEDEMNWRAFTSSRKVAWKTGTSFGFRDGWAVGVTPEYVIGVWTGNATGEGRPGLIGAKTAGPILFDLFNLLDETSWFRMPLFEVKSVPICRYSGHRASRYCEPVDTVDIPATGLETPPCPYHRLVHLDPSNQFRVNSRCMAVSDITPASWFVLPPVTEWYYRRTNADYRSLPPYMHGCEPVADHHPSMEFIYPFKPSEIYVPVELDGSIGKTVFEIAHREPDSVIYWHLDNQYLGMTRDFHQMALSPPPGDHLLTLIDDRGETIYHLFTILERTDR